MNNQENREGWQSQGESLNTGSQPGQQNDKKNDNNNSGGATLAAGNIGRSATQQVDPHSNSGLANTGTNISYEGPTAPGSGGSVGSGYASGKSAADPKISTNSDYEQANVGKHYDKAEGEDNITDRNESGGEVNY